MRRRLKIFCVCAMHQVIGHPEAWLVAPVVVNGPNVTRRLQQMQALRRMCAEHVEEAEARTEQVSIARTGSPHIDARARTHYNSLCDVEAWRPCVIVTPTRWHIVNELDP